MLLLSCVLIALLTISCASTTDQEPLIWGALTEIETLNPVLSESSTETDIMNAIFSTLIKVDEDLEFVPDLLEELPEISPDGLVYTFKLQNGVKFHDGIELTAEDVKFLYEMKLAPGNLVPSRVMWEKIAEFEIIDAYNFVITLKEADATWLEGWAYAEAMIVPKHIVEVEFKENDDSLTKGGKFSREPVGSGPYKFVQWKTTEYIMVERFDDYFKGKPQIEKLVYKFIPDTNTMLAQFIAGDIHMFEAQAGQYRELLNLKEIMGEPIEVVKCPGFIYMNAHFNLRLPVFKEKVVRQALTYAFPKQQYIDTVLDGIGTVAHSDVPEFSWAYNPDVKKYDFNPKKAEQLLEQAGWKRGTDGVREKDGVRLAFTLTTNTGDRTREAFQEIAKQEWEKIGAQVDIQNYEAPTLFNNISELKFDVAVFAWKAGYDPDATTLWHSSQIPDPNDPNSSGQNYIGYINPIIDRLLEDGLKETDIDKRQQIYYDIQEIISEEVPYLFVFFYDSVFAYPDNLKNFKPNPTQASNTWNIWEWELQ